LQERILGTKGQAHTTIQNGGHFLQEDQPDAIAELIDTFIKTTR
jgi:haloalkane dehalogenase